MNSYKIWNFVVRIYEMANNHRKQIIWALMIVLLQIVLVLWYLNFKKPLNSLENIENGIAELSQEQKDINNNIKLIRYQLVIMTEKDSAMDEQLKYYPAILPLAVVNLSKSSSVYSERIDPISGDKRFHWGIDYPAKIGTPVYATASGKIKKAESDGEYGKMIRIDHLNGYESLYAHLSIINVIVNENVERGDLIGNVGKTGRATGPHLHYEITYMEKHINPNIFRTPLKNVSDEKISGLLNYRNFIALFEN